MATRYEIQVGDEIIEFEGPDGMSEEQIVALAEDTLRTAKPGMPLNVQYDSSSAGALARGLPREASFNFGDEVTGFLNAAIPGLAALDTATGAAPDQQSYWSAPEGASFWDIVKQNAAAQRGQFEADDAQHPIASAVGKIGGALSTLPRAGAAVASRLPEVARAAMASRPIATGAVLGAGGGAASGAGAGEPGSRGQSAALGGFAGAALGGTVAGTLQLGPAVANYARIFFNRGSDREAIRQIVKALKRDGFDVTSPSGVQALRQELNQYSSKPVSLADIGTATRSRAGVGLRSPSDVQSQSISRVQQRQAGQVERVTDDIRNYVAPRTDVEALDEALVAQRSAQAQPLRERALYEPAPPPETPPGELMYHGGQPYMAREGITYFTPDREAAETYVDMTKDRFGGTGKVSEMYVNLQNPAPLDVVRETARKAGVDVESSTPASWFDENLHGRDAVEGLRRGLQAQGFDGTRLPDIPYGGTPKEIEAVIPFDQYAAVKPPVGGAGGRQARIVDDEILNNVIRTPLGQRALQQALDESRGLYAMRSAAGLPTEETPYIVDGASLDVRTLDMFKRYLDDEVGRLYRGQTSPRSFGVGELNSLKELRDIVRGRMREVIPNYGDYLDAYRGSSELIESLDEGLKYANASPATIAAGQANRSVAGQELYRVGAARNMLDKIRNTSDVGLNPNPANRILNSPEARDRLAATGVDPAHMAALNRSLEQERTMSRLGDELTGAQTNQRAMATADADAGANFQMAFNPGSPISWIGVAGRNLLNRASVQRNAAVNEELLPRMLETDKVGIDSIIRELEEQGNVALARSLRRRSFGNQAAGYGGVAIGSPVALPGEEY